MKSQAALNCQRCRQPLSQGNTYCVSCGFSNGDIESRKLSAFQEADRRIEMARLRSKLYRFAWFARLLR